MTFDDVHALPGDEEPAGSSRAHTPNTSDGNDAVVELAGEKLLADTEWVESGRVRLRRRIVSQTRTVEVVLRREELIIETHDIAPGAIGESYRGAAVNGPVVSGRAVLGPTEQPTGPIIVLLREEIPEIVLHFRVHERVIAHVVTVDEVAIVLDTARHEEADVITE